MKKEVASVQELHANQIMSKLIVRKCWESATLWPFVASWYCVMVLFDLYRTYCSFAVRIEEFNKQFSLSYMPFMFPILARALTSLADSLQSSFHQTRFFMVEFCELFLWYQIIRSSIYFLYVILLFLSVLFSSICYIFINTFCQLPRSLCRVQRWPWPCCFVVKQYIALFKSIIFSTSVHYSLVDISGMNKPCHPISSDSLSTSFHIRSN